MLPWHSAVAAATRIAFIRLSAAVVVNTVAYFRRRHIRLRTDRRTIHAVDGSRSARTQLIGHRTHGAAGSFIDGIVAIVIDAIASLGHRHDRLGTNDRAVVARARSERTSTWNARHTGHSTARIAFVDHAVAIVVFAVADFIARLHIRHALQCSIRTIQRTHGTSTRHARIAAHAAARIAFVHDRIAIVINAVANFHLRHTRHAGLRNTAHTSGHGHLTATHAARQHAEAVVDEQVAIVVDVIAGFGFRLTRRTRRFLTIDATFDGRQTSAGATRFLGDVFVVHPVAIVVLAIASFGLGQDFIFACAPCTVRTRLRACFAFAYADGAISTRITRTHFAFGRTGTIDSIVDFTVAIFIGAIAGFLNGIARRAFWNHAIDTTIDHDLTRAFSARYRRKVFIRLTIAIIVSAIAFFGPGQNFPATCAPFPARTSLGAALANTHSFGSARTAVTRLRRPIGACRHASALPPFPTLAADASRSTRASLARRRSASRIAASERQ